MSAANRRKTLPWVLGVVVLAFSVLAANRLVGTADAQPPTDPKGKAKEASPGGLTILGTVDAVPGVVRIDPPAVAGAFAVKEILVTDGKAVGVGDPLIQFDDAVFRAALAEAEAALQEAQWTRFKAQHARNDQQQLLRKQKLAVEAARYKWERAKEAHERATDVHERFLANETTTVGGPKLTDAEKERRRRENQDLLKVEALVGAAKFELDKEEIDLERLTTALTASGDTKVAAADADPNIAAAAIARYTAKVAQAKAMVDACLVKAPVAGTVEQILATPGMLYGPSTRTAAMQIVPSGDRIVRAEVDPEFVGRVADKAGKKVTITDSHHFNHTYEGVVDRVGTSLLPKRGGGELLPGPPAKVLECRIRILNPAPSGKPPLVVGQPVRVVFGS